MIFHFILSLLGVGDLFPQYKEEYDDECSFDNRCNADDRLKEPRGVVIHNFDD
jgi:hypothetical protein